MEFLLVLLTLSTKTLTMETDQSQEEAVVSEAKKKVKMLEPHIHVQDKEKLKRVGTVRTLYLNGLDCANCAAKIEQGVGKLEGSYICKPRFCLKKAIMEAANPDDLDRLENEATMIVKKLEPEVDVISEIQDSDHNDQVEQGKGLDHGREKTKKLVVRLSIGAVLAGFALFSPVSGVLELAYSYWLIS